MYPSGSDSPFEPLGPVPLFPAPWHQRPTAHRRANCRGEKGKIPDYPLGYLHVNFTGILTEEIKQYIFVADDRTSKLPPPSCTRRQARPLLSTPCPDRGSNSLPGTKVLIDNGIQFRNLPNHAKAGRYPFGRLCDEKDIEQHYTKPSSSLDQRVERRRECVDFRIRRCHR